MRISLILITIVFLFSCEARKEAVRKKVDSLSQSQKPDQLSKNVTVIFADSNFTKAVLTAKQARVFKAKNVTYLDSSVNVEFMSKYTNKRMSILTSDSAQIDDLTKDMIAMGNVIVISDSTGLKLETSVLEWSNIRQKIYSNQFVRITTANELILGYGFESNPNLSNYKIMKVSGIQRIR